MGRKLGRQIGKPERKSGFPASDGRVASSKLVRRSVRTRWKRHLNR